MAEKVTVMKLKVDLECHKCYKKVKKNIRKRELSAWEISRLSRSESSNRQQIVSVPRTYLGLEVLAMFIEKKLAGDGSMVAVKRLKDVTRSSGESQFRTELEMISLAVYRNLLRLIEYCATPNEKLLVYPYMSNGSVGIQA